MIKLLKADLTRIFKDKIFIILCVLGLFFAIVPPLILFVLFSIIGYFLDLDIIGTSFTGKEIFFNCFSPWYNFGVILVILVSVVMIKDFSYGTIRNKIISGYSRLKIYLSYLLSTLIVVFIIIVAYAIVSLAFSLMLTDYQFTPFVIDDLWYLLLSLLFVFLGYMMLSSLITFIGVFFKNIPLTIVFYFLIISSLSIISLFLNNVIPFFEGIDSIILTNIINIVKVLENCNIIGALTYRIGHGTSYGLDHILYFTIVPIVLTSVFTISGILSFKKRDIR